jgi:rhodanese-related sulfurtransferase
MNTAAELNPKEAQEYISSTPGLQLIDVRGTDEWADGYIPGAKLIPLHALQARMIELDRDKPVLLYCASGGRSSRALQFLLQQGYQAKHVSGGIYDWYQEGLPVVEGN